MVKLSTLQPAQIAAENWAYPTSLLPRRWADLNAVKALFFKKAETLGTESGDAGFSITHENRAADEPLYSEYNTGATLNNRVWGYGFHGIARVGRLPEGGVINRQVVEARIRLTAVANAGVSVGLTNYNPLEPTNDCVHWFYSSAVGANWQARNYQAAETQTDVGVPASLNWVTLSFEVEDTAIRFYLNGTLRATHTTNIPNGGLPIYVNSAMVTAWTFEAVNKALRVAYVAMWVE